MARMQRVVRAVVANAMLAVIIAGGIYSACTLGAKDTAPAVTPPVPVTLLTVARARRVYGPNGRAGLRESRKRLDYSQEKGIYPLTRRVRT
jgi:hypothetical protein